MPNLIRNAILLLLLIASSTSNAQVARLDSVMANFKQHFNAQDINAIYAMGSASFKTAIDKATLTQVMDQYYKAYGPLDSLVVYRSQELTGVYNGYFKNGTQDIALRLSNDYLFVGFRFLPTANATVQAKMEQNKTPMQFPLNGEWYVYWGGDTKAQNYHIISQSQRRAFDLVIIKDNKSYQRSGTRNEDYYAFGQPMYAVCDATVVQVITGVMDNKPGTMNAKQALGNSVTLKTEAEEYIVYAHFQQGTIKVKEGDSVKKGQFLGNCGNSGNSSEPHLHLHLQDGLNTLTAVGIKCFFESLIVNGVEESTYSPVQGETISRPTN